MKKSLLLVTLCCTGLLLTSCEQENYEQETTGIEPSASQDYELVEIELNGKMVMVQKFGKEYRIDDMIINVELNEDNKLAGKTGQRWPNNTVYYEIQSDVSNQSRITNAIAHWEARTSLTFIQRSNQTDYVSFREAGTCSSNVGLQGGVQYINLAPACTEGNTIHEIGHAIGLWHEHTRADRDEYIIFNEENADPTRLINFLRYDDIPGGVGGEDYTSEPDFGSVMMYDSYAFSINDDPTLTKLNGDTWEAQRNGLSVYDVRGIDQMYPTNNPTKINIIGSNGKFVSSENGEEPMICDRDTPNAWEEFQLIALSNGRVALKGNNGQFVSSENGLKPISCDRPDINSWEQFELVMYPGNQFSLKSTSSNKFVSSENGTKSMTCERDTPERWEIFTMKRAD